ncbi:uncharacterized protein LOC134839693 [Symsagittifera roscoffensis]|uniref:uncharacterized protein LOC134839693 n=1 Tax=Symsagittifera roscoffensis TaxID=84072 RepID=UPI00307C6602
MKSSLKFRHTCKSFKLFKPAAELINSMKSVDWTKPSAENLDQIRELGNKLCNELNEESFMHSTEFHLMTMGEVKATLFESGLFDLLLSICDANKHNVFMKHSPTPEENSCSGDSKHETESSSTCLSAQCLISVTHLLLQLLKSPLRREDRHLHTAKTSLLQTIFDQYEELFTTCLSILSHHLDPKLEAHLGGDEIENLAQHAAMILQISASNEKLLITGFLGGKGLRVLVETVAMSKWKPVRDTTLLLLKCFDREILSANFFLFQATTYLPHYHYHRHIKFPVV